jgi:hypothetical protein
MATAAQAEAPEVAAGLESVAHPSAGKDTPEETSLPVWDQETKAAQAAGELEQSAPRSPMHLAELDQTEETVKVRALLALRSLTQAAEAEVRDSPPVLEPEELEAAGTLEPQDQRTLAAEAVDDQPQPVRMAAPES